MTTRQMSSGTYTAPAVERVHYGAGSVSKLTEELDRLGASRALIITGRTLREEGTLLQRIRDLLGNRCAGVFSETRQHVPRPTVLAATKTARETKADLLVSFGGGSPIDTAKLVAMCLVEEVSDEDQFDRYRILFQYPDRLEVPVVNSDCLPHISISTTLSAGEFTNFAGATDEIRKVKDLYTGDGLWVTAAILDPEMATSTPSWLWASTGIRSVDHAIETVCSRNSLPVADALALEALRLLFQHLPASAADRQNQEAALICQIAAWMSISSLTNVQVGLSHGLGHQLGARADVPHGVTSCITLPRVLEFNRPFPGERLPGEGCVLPMIIEMTLISLSSWWPWARICMASKPPSLRVTPSSYTQSTGRPESLPELPLFPTVTLTRKGFPNQNLITVKFTGCL